MDLFVAIPAAVFFSAGIALFVFYERLVKRRHEVARAAWEAVGRPPGFIWAPADSSVMHSWVRGRAMSRWIRSTPDWIKRDPVAQALQRRMRLLWLAGFGSWLWIAIVAVRRIMRDT